MKIKTLNSLKYFLPATVLVVVAFWGLTAFKTGPSEKAGRPVRVVSLCFKDQEFNKIIKLVDQGDNLFSVLNKLRNIHLTRLYIALRFSSGALIPVDHRKILFNLPEERLPHIRAVAWSAVQVENEHP